jgi:hypothetical protein
MLREECFMQHISFKSINFVCKNKYFYEKNWFTFGYACLLG